MTGKAGLLIMGCTVHSALNLPTSSRQQKPLRGAALRRLQERFQDIVCLIIDECSMLSQADLAWVDRRCRQARPEAASQPFGGLTVVLCGDLGQLPPVGGRTMWAPNPRRSDDISGLLLFKSCTHAVCLQVILRQQGPAQQRFRDFLMRLRDGECTHEDWLWLSERGSRTMGDQEWQRFFQTAAATHLYITNQQVLEHNLVMLKGLQKPIVRIDAQHMHARDKSASPGVAMMLMPVCYLARGAKVLLSTNLWQQAGLVNGSVGVVVDLVYTTDQRPPSLPQAVIVDFPEYQGPPFFAGYPTWVPVPHHTAEWQSAGANGEVVHHMRAMIPLRLSWAWTIWKAQGQTMTGPIAVHLGDAEKSDGLTYVALSRAREIQQIGHEGISEERLTTKISRSKTLATRKAAELQVFRNARATATRYGHLLSEEARAQLLQRLPGPAP
jgi:ATP-dependent DNA helicase PIF1